MRPAVSGYVCFYADYISNDLLSVDEQNYLALERILELLRGGLLDYPGNILGLVDEAGHVLQFFVNQDESIELNISLPERFGSLTKQLDKAQCLVLLRQAPPRFTELALEGAVFEAWWASE